MGKFEIRNQKFELFGPAVAGRLIRILAFSTLSRAMRDLPLSNF
jgi:hypothetical protein